MRGARHAERYSLRLMNPQGHIGVQEKNLILLVTGLMLLVVIPVIGLTLYFAWRYRETNTKAAYAPKWSHATAIEVVVWSIPCVMKAVTDKLNLPGQPSFESLGRRLRGGLD
jgi:heme/copper-type cytochrome/quinol oxidase subunit 2